MRRLLVILTATLLFQACTDKSTHECQIFENEQYNSIVAELTDIIDEAISKNYQEDPWKQFIDALAKDEVKPTTFDIDHVKLKALVSEAKEIGFVNEFLVEPTKVKYNFVLDDTGDTIGFNKVYELYLYEGDTIFESERLFTPSDQYYTPIEEIDSTIIYHHHTRGAYYKALHTKAQEDTILVKYCEGFGRNGYIPPPMIAELLQHRSLDCYSKLLLVVHLLI